MFPNVQVHLIDFVDYEFLQDTDLLIHLAAYKHIDVGETHVMDFVTNNVYKTQVLFERANKVCSDILFMSTDKAVWPCSVYGLH